MLKQVMRKGVSIFLVTLFLFTMIPLGGILTTNVRAASTGKFDVKLRWRASWKKSFSVKNPTDNKTYSVSGPGTIIYLDGVTAYCLQLGAPATSNSSATLSKAGISDKSYFSRFPKDMQQQIARMLTLSQDLGTSGHDKYVYDYAKQLLVWEITLGYRNAGFEYKDNSSRILFNNIGNGAGAKDGGVSI